MVEIGERDLLKLKRSTSDRLDLPEIFKQADKDNSGTLSAQEFKTVLAQVGLGDVDDNLLKDIISIIDMDKNGVIDYAEFCEWISTKVNTKRIRTKQPRDLVLSASCTEAMGCPYFMSRWDAFKKVADAQVAKEEASEAGSAEYDLLSEWMTDEWLKVVKQGLKDRAAAAGLSNPEDLQKQFAEQHIAAIGELGYNLDEKAKTTLSAALERFYVCDIGPAPFSLHAVTAEEKNESHVTVTVAEHCLQLATHWVRHPPSFLMVGELEELVVLTLFHDVYYYDDFPHHDSRTLDLFKPYLRHTIPAQVVGGHVHLRPDVQKVKTFQFENELDALQNEWVQMDWYLTMINMKQKGKVKNRVGDGITLPLEFFHHYLGRFLTKNSSVIPVAKESLGGMSTQQQHIMLNGRTGVVFSF